MCAMVGKEVEFEVGKWYSIKTAYNWIIKFKEIKHGNIRADWHCLNERGKKVEEGGYWESKPTEIKELSIEEIQQYLPEGHPDKIIKNPIFEAGKWYRVTDGKNKAIGKRLWYVKSPKVIDNIIICEEYWYNGSLLKDGNFGTIGDYTFTEVPLSEIQQFLPDGHPDLVTTGNKEVKDISKTFTIRVTSREVKRIKI